MWFISFKKFKRKEMSNKYVIEIKPISVNQCWQGRRFKTKKYKDWREEFCWLLISKKIKKIKGDVDVKVIYYIKHYKTSDVDNFNKATLDALVESRVIEDDRFVQKICAIKKQVKNKEDERIEFEIKKINKLKS